MQKVNVSISGMDRALDSGICPDGQSLELINMRVEDGSLKPVGRPILEQGFPSGHEPVFVHKNSGFEHYITYDGTNLRYDYDRYDNAFHAVGTVICSANDIVSVEAVGNLLVIVKSNNIGYALWNNNTYSYIGGKPQLPCITFTKEEFHAASKQAFAKETYGIPSKRSDIDIWTEYTTFQNDADGALNKLKDDCYERGRLFKHCFLRYGIRLIDGSVIMQSPVYFCKATSQQILFNGDPDKCKCEAWMWDYGINYNIIDAKNIGQWSKLVASVDVFMCMRDGFDTGAKYPVYTASDRDTSLYEFLPVEPISNQTDLFGSVDNFYLIHSFNIDDVTELKSGSLTLSKDILKNLEQQEPMPMDNFSHNTVTGKVAYTYNGRLHLANTKTLLFEGFDPRYYQATEGESSTYNSSSVYTSINAENGIQRVQSDVKTFTGKDLSPIIIFPDFRALNITFSNGANKGFLTKLKKHPFLNVAYYQDPDLEPIKANNVIPNTPQVNIEPIIDSNKIKVSALNNPLSFPSDQTYTVSNGDILNICTATTALSTGQFGQFPLYVFSSDGVYALEVGNSDIVYSRSTAVSREVCNNKNAIISTDKAVIFTTESSLLMLNGSESINLSEQIEGYLPTMTDSSPVIEHIADIVDMFQLISGVEFREYMNGCRLGYNYYDREIIVSNRNYPYSYVFNLASKGWYKISCQIKFFVNTYPECFAYFTDGGVYNMYNPHRTVNNILLISKPIKFGSVVHKRILQSSLRAIVRPSQSDVYYRGETVKYRDKIVNIFSNCGFYILGSNDAEHFTLIAGREKIADVRDLITKMNKSKAYKYFSVCLAGGVRTDVAFNYFEFILDETYTNRLR